MSFIEAEHPRLAGRFVDKEQSSPQLTLDRPFGEDQARLADLGFVVSEDRELIEGYSVEPGMWLQAVSEPDLRLGDLSANQRDAVARAARILDDRRGRPEAGTVRPWHRADCYAEELGGTAVYIRSRPEAWTEDSHTLRVLIDSEGGVVDAREQVTDSSGAPVWNEL